MKIYILHETHSLCDYNDHEVFTTYEDAKKLLEETKVSVQAREQITEVYYNEDEEYYVQVDGDSIRIYITEHTINQ
jgi:hypothetical protein